MLEPHADRFTWDAPIHSIADIEALPYPPKMVNVKPSRFGGLQSLMDAYDYLAERGIGAYGGGQFELGPGRGHIQYLASLFHPDTPNDVAPGGYNLVDPPAGPARQPARAAPDATRAFAGRDEPGVKRLVLAGLAAVVLVGVGAGGGVDFPNGQPRYRRADAAPLGRSERLSDRQQTRAAGPGSKTRRPSLRELIIAHLPEPLWRRALPPAQAPQHSRRRARVPVAGRGRRAVRRAPRALQVFDGAREVHGAPVRGAWRRCTAVQVAGRPALRTRRQASRGR